MAVKLSRDGHPGPLEVRFGTAEGKADLGIGTLTCDNVLSLYEYLEPVMIEPRAVAAGQSVYYEIRAGKGRLPEDHYLVFGPRPASGKDQPESFALSYHVLTDRPQDSLENPSEQPTFYHIKQMSLPYHRDDAGQTSFRLSSGRRRRDGHRRELDHTLRARRGTKVVETAADDLAAVLRCKGGHRRQARRKPARRTAEDHRAGRQQGRGFPQGGRHARGIPRRSEAGFDKNHRLDAARRHAGRLLHRGADAFPRRRLSRARDDRPQQQVQFAGIVHGRASSNWAMPNCRTRPPTATACCSTFRTTGSTRSGSISTWKKACWIPRCFPS